MYQLSLDQRARIIGAICEGNSIRATCRLTGAAKGTVLRLLAEVGAACQDFHDKTVRCIKASRVQCDEIWSFCHAKARNVPPKKVGQAGDLWTWVALDQDSKLAISFLVADRGQDAATFFARDLASRLANRVQLTTDGHSVYLAAIAAAFHYDVDYAMLVKHYGAAPIADARRYSPPVCIGATKTWVSGNPHFADVSTSHVERQNLTMRMQSRRYTRLTNGFSKKAENHAYATALYFMHYNFCRVHQTLTKRAKGIQRTPAMEAGLTNRVWTVTDLLMLLPREHYRAGAA